MALGAPHRLKEAYSTSVQLLCFVQECNPQSPALEVVSNLSRKPYDNVGINLMG